MALYKYLAAARGEGARELLIEADSPEEATGKLRERKLQPVRFLGEQKMGAERSLFSKKSRIDTFAFTRQLAPLLNSFVPLDAALGIIAESSAEPAQRDFVISIRQGLREGKKFSAVVRAHGNLFPDYYANLIESGEETGCLPDVLTRLYSFMSESRDLRGFIVSSSIYPIAILCVVAAVTVLMFTVFVPKFARIFADMGRDLPPSMTFLLTLSSFFRWAWWLIPLALILGRFALIRVFGRDVYFDKATAFRLKIPLFGRIIADLEMCRYLRTLSIMILNHVEIIRTVKIAGRILHIPVIERSFRNVSAKLKSGEKLSAALTGNPYLPREMVPMLRVGEESGTVGDMLGRIAGNLEADTRQKIKRLLSLFEPAVIILLALVVLVVVVSIFLAMMDINAINQGDLK